MYKKQTSPVGDFSPRDFNVRRDVLVFIEYVRKRGIKRSHRDNQIPQSDRKRLAKLLEVPELIREIEPEEGYWAEWICSLARRLKLITYDTEGIYVGYTSQSESYPDNYIKIDETAITKYLALSSAQKERHILDVLIHENANEFYEPSLLGTQGRFDTFGSAVGAASRMDRRRLLAMLASYPAGSPVPFMEFFERVHREEPNLIIDHDPKPPQPADKKSQRAFRHNPLPQTPRTVYECLYEHRNKIVDGAVLTDRGTSKEISEKDPDAYFRAEGRYLAYFLEDIPVLMQFIQLEYQEVKNPLLLVPDPPNFIKNFTVTEKLGAVLDNRMPDADRVKVTISPDFTILIEALLYPDTILTRLAPYTVLKSSHHHTHILELSRDKTIETLTSTPAARPLADVLADVATLSSGPIPRNVAADIAEWTGHAEKCVVFEDVALIEMRNLEPGLAATTIKGLGNLVTHTISPRFALATHAAKVFNHLEALELVPVSIHHADSVLRESLLPRVQKAKRAPGARAKHETASPEATWLESNMAAYTSNNRALLQAVATQLREANITPVLLDKTEDAGLLVVPDTARAKVNSLIRKLRDTYNIRFQ